MQILYLDFDGVLHPDAAYWKPGRGPFLLNQPDHALFENVPLLVDILAPFPDVRIVLSTSWVPVLGFSRARKRLGPALAERVVGATFHSRHMDRRRYFDQHANEEQIAYHELSRGMQVWQDVCRRQPTAWIAIDDDPTGWPAAHRHRLVLSDKVAGINLPATIAQLNEMLAKCHQAGGLAPW